MKILLLGKTGQVGNELNSLLIKQKEYKLLAFNRNELNLENFNDLKKIVLQYTPNIIINAAAYTNVDKAEKEKSLCKILNAELPEFLGSICHQKNIILIHYSTDYVFDGKTDSEYREDDKPNPINFYGKTKLLGEFGIRNHHPMHIIMRTSWVYSSIKKNFLKTIIKLIKTKKKLTIINDQYGIPTSAKFIAEITMLFINRLKSYSENNIFGTYNVVPDGKTDWFSFSRIIAESVKKYDHTILCDISNITPISTNNYITDAKRPKNSVLCNNKLKRFLSPEIQQWEYYLNSVILSLLRIKND